MIEKMITGQVTRPEDWLPPMLNGITKLYCQGMEFELTEYETYFNKEVEWYIVDCTKTVLPMFISQ